MHVSFKYRIYPNSSQVEVFAKHFGCARFAYNYALALKIKSWQADKKTLTQFDLCKVFPKLKKQEGTEWLSEVCSHSLQCEMANLDSAFTRFFRNKKGFPKFKSKHRDKNSYSTNVNIFIGEDFIQLPKVGKVKAVISRPIAGRIVKATVMRTCADKFFVSLLCENSESLPPKMPFVEKNTIGIDLGLNQFVTLSTGEKVENPRYFKKSFKKLRRAQRRMSRCINGSSNRMKKRKLVARIHEKISNQRNDFHHKLSTRLVGDNQTNAIALETLSVSGMQKNKHIAKSIRDVGWSSFVSMVEYKSERVGKTVLKIGRFEPSSKLCSCGTINQILKLSDRKWTCASCGAEHDRDILAANNIKRMALHSKNLNTVGNTGIYACGE